MDRRTVLLVHAGAPSSKSVDQQAIAQAESYLSIQDHEPARRTVIIASGVKNAPKSTEDANLIGVARVSSSNALISSHADNQLNNKSTGAPVLDHHEESAASSRVQNSLEYIDDTQLAYTALESQLFTSSTAAPANSRKQRHISSPCLADARFKGLLTSTQNDRRAGAASPVASLPRGTTPETFDEQNSSGSGDLGITAGSGDSSNERQVKRPRRTTADVADHDAPAGKVHVTPSGAPFGRPPAVAIPGRMIEYESRISGTCSSDETTSELPRSYSWGDSTSNGRSTSLEYHHKHSESEYRPVASQNGNHGPVLDAWHSQPLATVVVPSTAVDPICRLGLGGAVEDQINVETVLERAHVAVQHLSAVTGKHAQPNSPPQPHQLSSEAELLALAPEIHARKPMISVKRFETSVTKELRDLYGKFATKYEPLVVSRQIDTLERGYWSINCTPWSTSKKLAFWQFLEIWIGNGSAGWSVWCSRVADQHLGPDIGTRQGASTSGAQQGLDHLRVYCWGEIIGHIYVLLYTASEGGVRKLGLQWIDSDLRVVVQMRPQTIAPSESGIGAS